ncbi:MAG TPA: FUSC family protein [Gammaproteobacteria bacterium]|jgi:hypothetical protein
MTVIPALRLAIASMAAVLLSFGATYALCLGLGVNASPAILAAALSMGLMRRPEKLEPRALLMKLLALPVIAFAAGLVGFAFLKLPALGAVLFTGGIVLSILLRKYGERGSAIGRVIALPMITILAVPPAHIEGAHSRLMLPLLVIAAGVIASLSTFAISRFAARFGVVAESEVPNRVRPPAARSSGPHIAVRMALQMLTALILAFVIGMTLFPEHWFWIVLTAFIVCSGTVDRGGAVYKGVLRLTGAIGGALAATSVAYISFPNPQVYAAAVFFILFLGIWLRQINYAYWAGCATLIFALLQETRSLGMVPLLEVRVLCIVIGALCGVAATWFVYPVRTEQLVKKRVAEALSALRELLGHKPGSPEYQSSLLALHHHAAELEQIAPPVRLHHRLFGAKDPDRHPATWLQHMRELLLQARSQDADRAQLGAGMKRLGAMLKGDARPEE